MIDKKYDHKSQESLAQELWEKENTYSTQNNSGELYSIDTPPPTISGSLHIGHVFSYTQTDVIARYKRMTGYSVFYPFGFDDNGLPTEKFVEKKLNIKAQDIGRSEFIKLCLKETKEVEKEFKSLWQKIGLSIDWSKTYSTISKEVRKISQLSFLKLLKKDHIYRKEAPALYCTTCQTAVAQAELEDKECPTKFSDIIFKTKDNHDLIVATTRPELLGSCVALLYNPEDERYQSLKGQKVIVPIFNFEVPVLPDEKVEKSKGTGLVMVCTFGDKTDIEWYQKFSFPYKESITKSGKLSERTGPLAGLNVKQARKKILELLEEQNLLANQKEITHNVNVHERCKTPIEYIVSLQWFLKIIPYKEDFLKEGQKINWYPDFMKLRYKDWVENINWDWCLSRQRFYGIPFPVWHCVSCKEILLPKEQDLPIDPQEVEYQEKYNSKCSNCPDSKIIPDTDVMDTWNTSSLTPYIDYSAYSNNWENPFDQATKEKFIPMSLRPQAHDIIRTWAFYTIVKAWLHNDTIPWNDIVISGHVLSTEKEKISKSRGNVKLTPQNLLEEYPADAIRYWASSGTLGQDTAFSENKIKIGQKLLVKLWNAFRFVYSNLEDFTPESLESLNINNLGTANKWILDKASICYKYYTQEFDKYNYSAALETIERFFWSDYCDNYLELIKDQLFNPEKYKTEEIEATKNTLYNIGLRILQLYAPFVPHITEALYQLIYKDKYKTNSIHQLRFNKVQKFYEFKDSIDAMNHILEVVDQVRKLKTANQLSLKTELAELIICTNSNNLTEIFKENSNLLKGVTKAQNIAYHNNCPEDLPKLEQKDNIYYAFVTSPHKKTV